MTECMCGQKFCRKEIILEYKPLTINPKKIERFMSTNKIGDSNSQAQTGDGAEFKDQNIKYVLSKFEYDLYNEEDDISNPVIRVKRMSMPNKGEKWKILEDNKAVFTIEGTKLTLKEREFLRTVDGVNFMLSQAKSGIKSVNAFKTELKKLFEDKQAKEKKSKSKKK